MIFVGEALNPRCNGHTTRIYFTEVVRLADKPPSLWEEKWVFEKTIIDPDVFLLAWTRVFFYYHLQIGELV